jgi:hypothetical protein
LQFIYHGFQCKNNVVNFNISVKVNHIQAGNQCLVGKDVLNANEYSLKLVMITLTNKEQGLVIIIDSLTI